MNFANRLLKQYSRPYLNWIRNKTIDVLDQDYISATIARSRKRKDESIDLKKARLLYQSRKRGMLENDLILSSFADKYLNKFNENELEMYDNLLSSPSNDWDIYYWIVGKEPTPVEYDNVIMDMLKEHAKNAKKENRTRQPDLY